MKGLLLAAVKPRPTTLVAIFFALSFCSLCSSTPLARSVSSSRQFIVFGGDVRLRGAVSDLAENTKARLLTVLREPDRWTVPILLNLQQPQTNVPEIPTASLNFSQTGAGLKIQLDLLVGNNLPPANLQREILRALVLEMSYRAHADAVAGEPYSPPPDWLVDGILNFNSAESANAVGYLAQHSVSLKTLLNQRPALLDSQSQTVYRAAAAVLVQALAESGPEALKRYITDLPNAGNDAVAFFQQHFSWIKNDDLWWQATVPRIAEAQSFTLLSYAANSEQLDELLKTTVAHLDKQSLTLEQASRAPRPEVDRGAASALGKRLLLLSARAHPLMRPVVTQYQFAAELLAKKRRAGLAKRLEANTELRRKLTIRMQAVDDFMNWFEATQAKTASGEFENYARAVEQSEAVPRRRDSISVYLDAMEMQF